MEFIHDNHFLYNIGMGIFKRRRDEEEEYDEGEEINSRGSLKTKPRRKSISAKKETNKPWGKKERFWVLGVFLLTIVTSGVLALSARSWKLPGLPRIKIPDKDSLSIPFLSEETIILENTKVSDEKQRKSEEIKDEFKTLTRNLSGVYGLYVVDLESGYSFGVNERESFEPASLLKLPVIFTLYWEEEKGNINLEKIYTLKNTDKISGSGSLSTRAAGYEISYREMAKLMGKESDNTSYGVLKSLLGQEKIDESLSVLGMKDTSYEGNITTAYDVGTFFRRLYETNLISDGAKEEITDSLIDTIYENHLAAGVPESVKVAHKYGREVHVINDAGYILTDEPFVIVILSKGVVETEADNVFPELARIVYEGWVD